MVNQTKNTLMNRLSTRSSSGTGVTPRNSTPYEVILLSQAGILFLSCDSTSPTLTSATVGLEGVFSSAIVGGVCKCSQRQVCKKSKYILPRDESNTGFPRRTYSSSPWYGRCCPRYTIAISTRVWAPAICHGCYDILPLPVIRLETQWMEHSGIEIKIC